MTLIIFLQQRAPESLIPFSVMQRCIRSFRILISCNRIKQDSCRERIKKKATQGSKHTHRVTEQTQRCGCQSQGHTGPAVEVFRAVLRTQPLSRNSNQTLDIDTASFCCRRRTPSSSGASPMTPERGWTMREVKRFWTALYPMKNITQGSTGSQKSVHFLKSETVNLGMAERHARSEGDPTFFFTPDWNSSLASTEMSASS